MVVDERSRAVAGGSLSRVGEVFATEHAGLYASFVEEPADASVFYEDEATRRPASRESALRPR